MSKKKNDLRMVKLSPQVDRGEINMFKRQYLTVEKPKVLSPYDYEQHTKKISEEIMKEMEQLYKEQYFVEDMEQAATKNILGSFCRHASNSIKGISHVAKAEPKARLRHRSKLGRNLMNLNKNLSKKGR